MKKAVLFLLIMFVSVNVFARSDEEIIQLLEEMGIEVNIPDDFTEVEKVEQEIPGTYYDKGYKHKYLDIEYRYYLMPASDCGTFPGFYINYPKTIFSNIADDMYYIFSSEYIYEFTPDLLVYDYLGAEKSYAAYVVGKSDFLGDYAGAMILTAFSENRGLFMIFQLFADVDMLKEYESYFYEGGMILRFIKDEKE